MKQLGEKIQEHIELLISRYTVLEPIKEDIIRAYHILGESYMNGGKVLIAGNGGSAADAEHMEIGRAHV